MKLKFLGVLLLVCLMATSVFATSFTWNGTELNGGASQTWSDPCWSATPVSPGNYNDEYKLNRQQSVCRINSAVGPYNGRLGVSSGINTGADVNGSVLNISGGSITVSEFRAGAQGTTAAGSIGRVYQTAGTVTMKVYSSGTSYSRNLILGRCGASGQIAQGYYKISGGAITYSADPNNTAAIIVGGSVNGSAYVAPSGGPASPYTEGTFTVDGNAAGMSITMRKLYVGTDGTYSGKGTIAFQIGDSGVCKIVLADACSIVLDATGTSGTTNLVLTALSNPPASDIVLIQQTDNTSAVAGIFDKLNGVVGGTWVVLGSNTYTLTYKYNAEAAVRGTGNDIALLIPEPATIALLSLGLFAIRRKK
jgi:hypothetical protein